MADNLPHNPDKGDADTSQDTPKPSGPLPEGGAKSDSEALGQSELDALISSLKSGETGEEPVIEASVPAEPAQLPSDMLDESDMDALIASIMNDQDADAIEVPEDAIKQTAETRSAGLGAEPSGDKTAGPPQLIEQEELDALIEEARARFASEDAAAGAEGRISEDLSRALDEESALQGGSGAEDIVSRRNPEEMAASALLTQEELDELFASQEGTQEPEKPESSSTTDAPEDAPPPAEQAAAPEAASPLLSQDDLDSLLAEMDASPETGERETATAGAAEANANMALGQSEMDALIRQMTGDVPEESQETSDEEVTDQADMDTLLAQVDKTLAEDDDALSDKVGEELKSQVIRQDAEDPAPGDVAPPRDDAAEGVESLTDEELDSVLAGEDGEEPLDAQTLDTVLPESEAETADMDAVLSGSGEESPEAAEVGDDERERSAAKARRPEPDPDALAAAVPEESNTAPGVGSENLAAAGTVQEGRTDTDEAAQEAIDALINKPRTAPAQEDVEAVEATPRPPAPEPAVEEEIESPAPVKRRRTRRFSRPRLPRVPLAKLGSSLAAGLVFGLACYFFLSNYETRRPGLAVPDVTKTQDLERLVERARTLMAAEDFESAWHLLEGPVRQAPPSPLRTEAELLRIEAAYRSLPPRPPQFDVELVNSYIDNFLLHGDSHSDAPKVLEWKADLYERAGIPHAAYDIYAQILRRYGDASAPSALFQAGRLAFETERYHDAAQHLERLVTAHAGSPHAPEGRLLLGRALSRTGRQAEGEALLRRVADANVHNALGARAHTVLARMAFDEGDYDNAIALLRRRLESGATSEGNDEVLLLLSESYRAANQRQEAQDALRDIIRFFPDAPAAPQAYIDLSELLEQAGRRDDALRMVLEAAQRHAGNPDVLLQYARMRERAGDSRGAAEALVAAEEAGAADPQVLLTAGNLFLHAGYSREAEDTFQQLTAAFPGTPQAIAGNVALAQIAAEQGEAGRAMQLMDDMARLAQNTPQETEVLLALGDLCQGLGLQQRAAQAYRDAATTSSEPEVLARAAMALYSAGAWAEGNEVARRVEPDRLTEATAFAFLMEHGHAMLRADSRRGMELMERAWGAYPEQRNLEAAERLVDACLALDRLEAAIAVAEGLFEKITPANVEIIQRIAVSCADYAMRHEDHDTAVALYQRVLSISPRETEALQWARFQLANALHAQGHDAESRPLLESVAGSVSPWASEAQLRLDYLDLHQRMRHGDVPMPATEG